MELELTYQELRYKKRVLHKRFTKEEVLEVNLSEAQPDALRVAAATATPLMRSKDAEAGRMTVTGSMDISVLYVAEAAPEKCKISTSREFSASVDCADVGANSLLTAEISVVSAEARLINSRKLHIRVELLYTLAAYEDTILKIPTGFANGKNIESLTEEKCVTLPYSVSEKTFSITDSPALSGICDIISSTVSFTVEDVRSVGSKAVVRGTARTRLLYTANAGYVTTATLESPFSQVVELDADEEYADYLITVMATGLYVAKDIGGEGGEGVSLELHGVIQCVAYKSDKLNILTDVYSTAGSLVPELSEETVLSHKCFETVETDFDCNLKIPQEVRSIDAVLANTGLVTVSKTGDCLNVYVPMNLSVVYTSAAEELFGASRSAECTSEGKAYEGDIYEVVTSFADAENAEYNMTEDGIAVRLAANTTLSREMPVCLTYISGATLDESEEENTDCPSIIAYRVADGDTLWQIAKRYRSAKDSVLKANGMESDSELKCGKLILIPKK